VPLGILNQQVWARERQNIGIAKKRRQRQTNEKESQRWLDSLKVTQQLIPPDIKVVTMGDSEADIFDLFACERPENSHLLIRGTHNRRVDHYAEYLHLPPKQPPSLREAVRMIATLGGFLGRKRDGEPGVKTIWRGLRRLHDIAATWRLLH
jgi:hypothetical protein